MWHVLARLGGSGQGNRHRPFGTAVAESMGMPRGSGVDGFIIIREGPKGCSIMPRSNHESSLGRDPIG